MTQKIKRRRRVWTCDTHEPTMYVCVFVLYCVCVIENDGDKSKAPVIFFQWQIHVLINIKCINEHSTVYEREQYGCELNGQFHQILFVSSFLSVQFFFLYCYSGSCLFVCLVSFNESYMVTKNKREKIHFFFQKIEICVNAKIIKMDTN